MEITGIDIAGALKAILGILALVGAFFGIRGYGKAKEEKGRQKGVSEAREVNDESFKALADDVLNGGTPWGVRQPDATEVSGPELDSGVRMAPDVHGNGREGGSDGDPATTS
jgi:hypothetical protein